MLLLSLLRKLTTNSWVLLKSPMPALSQPIRWLNVTHVTANTWPAVCCTVVTWFLRMWMQLLQQSRPREPFSLWTGVQLALRFVLELYKAKLTLFCPSSSTTWLHCSALTHFPLFDHSTLKKYLHCNWHQLFGLNCDGPAKLMWNVIVFFRLESNSDHWFPLKERWLQRDYNCRGPQLN